MKQIEFDFDRISNIEDFYTIVSRELVLPEYFGRNLDALWDVLTGDIALPLTIKFVNLSLGQLEIFEKIISLFEEAADELYPELVFEYYLKP